MKIAALADQSGRRALENRVAGTGILIAWEDSVDALSGHTDAIAYFDLSFKMDKRRILRLSDLLPKPVFINSVVHTLEEIGRPFIRINAWPGFLERKICELVFPADAEKEAAGVLDRLCWRYLAVADLPGMVSPRILATIINEAYYTLQEGVSARESIDTAMRLGTHYPYGPFEWASIIGLSNIYSLLIAMGATDPCYKLSDLLKEEALKMRIDY
ncbi:MAG: 3-hydroxyacyl-CoA dehydrogenase family protein [Puia sp.]|nr:3-hydroxyacyl-CoA dehydrogenase family protein [Puia sp.]